MDNIILKKQGPNFFGFESIDQNGEHHNHLNVVRGNGDLLLTPQYLHFKQWITEKEYSIPIEKIIKVELKRSHNLKAMWPGKVLRVYYNEGEETKIFGVALGGKLSLTKGWKDDAHVWKEQIEALIKH